MKLVIIFALFISLHPVFGQDPIQIAPDNYRVVFENERVRVLAFHAAPGAKWALHAHPDAVVVSLNGYEVRNVVPGAMPTTRKTKRGDVAWIPARSHTGENIGGTDMDCILVELKEPKK
jgi:quercetin dioxygenase-like cupin family protein